MDIQKIEEIDEKVDEFQSPFFVDMSKVKMNELIRAVKQLDKQMKELKEEN